MFTVPKTSLKSPNYFFKVVYRRTELSDESIQQTFSGTVGVGSRQTATISMNLVRMYLEFTSTQTNNDDNPGHGAIVRLDEIGGQQIDKHYGHWMEN